jgi:hypothetical protein
MNGITCSVNGKHFETVEEAHAHIRSKPVTVGWDSIDSNVDAFELKESDLDLDDSMAQPKPAALDDSVYYKCLVDITRFVSRARRDVNALNRIVCQYGLNDVKANAATAKIVSETLKTVRFIANGS